MKHVILTLSAIALVMNMSAVQAEDNQTEERVGFSTGLVIGAIAGGPAGAIISAVAGAWLGDKVNEADKVPVLHTELASKTTDLNQLKRELVVADTELHEVRAQLVQQEITQQKVSQQKHAVTGLKFDVMFRTNSSELQDDAIEKLIPIALLMEQYADYDIQLTGHGDVVGTVDGNRIVAEDRALRVKQSLLNAGIDTRRVHIINLGNTQAMAELVDVEGRAMERRVRIQFVESTTAKKPSIAQN